MNMLQDMARYSKICYDNPKGTEPLFKDCIDFVPMQNDIDYGCIVYYKDRIVIAFKGTVGVEAWIEDFRVAKLAEGNTIHKGFYDAWVNFKKPIQDYLKNYYTDDSFKLPIFCTGHSRGAAITTLCARHLKKNMKLAVNVSNINFGSPALGNGSYRDEYGFLGIYTTRVVNGYDIVTDLPPHDFGFRHVGTEVHLPQPAIHKWFWRIRDHYIENYEKALNKIV
jgi:hypothetical protein